MSRLVMKFGGTSVANIDRIRNVARHVKRECNAGHDVAVVVSAMSGKTNELVAWCKDASALVFVASSKTMSVPGKDEPVPSRTHSFDTGAAWMAVALQAHAMGWHALRTDPRVDRVLADPQVLRDFVH